MKKRHWLAWLCVLMLCAGVVSAGAETLPPQQDHSVSLASTGSAVLMNDKLYYLADDAVEAIASEYALTEMVLPYPPVKEGEDGLLWLNSIRVAGKDQLYLWDWDDGVLYELRPEGANMLFQADPAILSVLNASDWGDDVWPRSALVQGNYFYLISTSADSDFATRIMRFDLRDGSGIVLNLDDKLTQDEQLGLRELTPYKDGKILCMASYARCLLVLDGESGKLLETIPIAENERCDAGGLAYDAATDSIYYVVQEKLMRGVGEDARWVQTLQSADLLDWKWHGLWNGQYAFYDSFGVQLYDLPPVKPVGDAA